MDTKSAESCSMPEVQEFVLEQKDKIRFFERFKKTRVCWKWIGSKNQYGYGVLHSNNFYPHSYKLAHRLAYELFVSKIPDSLQIDHLCRNRDCVNPKHMELVTLKENVLRGIGISAMNARKKLCKNGHEFDFITTSGARVCRPCKIEYQKNRRAMGKN